MPRDGTTQVRTFTYDTATQRLSSATNPENGTVSYTYNADGTLATRTDARGQRTEYSYDPYRRPTQVRHFVGTGEDLCQRVDFYYDSNPFDGTISQNAWGRRTAEVFKTSCTATQTVTFTQMYGYQPVDKVFRGAFRDT